MSITPALHHPLLIVCLTALFRVHLYKWLFESSCAHYNNDERSHSTSPSWHVYSCPNWTQFSTGIIVQFYSIRGHVNALLLRQLYNGWLTGGPSSRDKMAQKPTTDNGGHRNSFSCPIHVLHSPFHYWQRRSSLLSRFRSGNVGA